MTSHTTTGPQQAAGSNMNPDTIRLARAGFCYGQLAGYGFIELYGPDAGRFLQNQSTQDINSLGVGQSKAAASVDRQGKTKGFFTVYRIQEQRYWLLIEQSQIEGLMAHWQVFKLFDQFEMTANPQSGSLHASLGKQAAKPLSAVGLDDLTSDIDYQLQMLNEVEIPVFRLNWAHLPGRLFCVPDNLKALQGGVELTPTLQEALRVEGGWPKFAVDISHETLFPETGLQESAVSYDKGCYLGQEVIARVKTYGSLQRALCGLIFEPNAALPPPGSVCSVSGKPVGTIQSGLAVSSLDSPIALAYLDKSSRIPGQTIQFEAAGNPYQATVTLLPFVAIEVDPGQASNDQASFHQALQAFAQGDDIAAIEQLEILAGHLNQPLDNFGLQVVEALGAILSRHERVDEAIALMERLLASDPDHIMAHTNLSILYLKKGDKDRAEEEKAKATVAGMRQKAKAAGFDLDKLDAERQAREAEKNRQLEERIQLFKDALSYAPEDPLGNFGLGAALLELKRYEEAIEPFQKTIAAQPKHSVAYLSLGKAFEGNSQTGQAKSTYLKGIEVAASRGDRMPLEEMQQRLGRLD